MFLGRVVRRGHPQWTDADRGYALAWQQNKNATCSCGTRKDEWDEDRDAYAPETAYCRGHELLGMQEENLPTDAEGRRLSGYFTYLKPREQWAREQAATAPN